MRLPSPRCRQRRNSFARRYVLSIVAISAVAITTGCPVTIPPGEPEAEEPLCETRPDVCDDDNPCTEDRCEPSSVADSDGCVNEPVLCDDGDLCTDDSCDPETGECVRKSINCADNDACTQDSCESETGVCNHEPIDCDDRDPCTDDSCVNGNCVNTGIDCDDDDLCTTDSCDADTAECANTPVDCDDNDPCTTDSCDLDTGDCLNEDPDCDDGNVCTDDSCDAGACEHVSNSAPCNDGNLCTTNDSCFGGSCSGSTINCNDGNPCTSDACANGGCVFALIECPSGRHCKNGACVACDDDTECNDGLACTEDTCDAGDCVYTNIDARCNDGLFCTGSETCDPVDADADADGCVATSDPCSGVTPICNESTDLCEACQSNAECGDEDACNGVETCDGVTGDCVDGTPVECDAGETCNPATGECAAPDPCEGATCAGCETCVDGACQPLEGDAAAGETYYSSAEGGCSNCHGADGSGPPSLIGAECSTIFDKLRGNVSHVGGTRDVTGQDAADLEAWLMAPVVPVCGDNVIDPGEQCDPPDDITCDQDCQIIRLPTVCGNGVIEDGERCDPPDGVLCDDNCQTISSSGSVCGNIVVEAGEECDPPNGNTCDVNCQTTTGGLLANDSCVSPTTITEGSRAFSNVGATTDGPQTCAPFGNPQIDSDIWYCFTAQCSESITVSLCGSAYDTKVAVYLGCECPDASDIWLACSDDDCGAGLESRTTFPGLAGQDYLIRVGGFRGFVGEQGTGTLTIFCESDPDHGLAACGPGAGDCFSANGSPGCDDVEVCEATCAVDASCCDRLWDDLCATKADGIANGFDTCGPGSGSCTEDVGTPGCDDTDCCQAVCEADPFCCLTNWDEVCADAVPDACGVLQACVGARGTCFTEHVAPGCQDESCCVAVCEIDPLCCTASWDDICVGHAESCVAADPCEGVTCADCESCVDGACVPLGGDATAGETYYSSAEGGCSNCHGPDGEGPPSLIGAWCSLIFDKLTGVVSHVGGTRDINGQDAADLEAWLAP